MRNQLPFLLAIALLGTVSAEIEVTGEVNPILDGSGLLNGLPDENGCPLTDTCSNAVSRKEQRKLELRQMHLLTLTLQCSTLSKVFGDRVASSGDPAYIYWPSTFWSKQQGEVDPYCIFQPSNAADVSTALNILREEQCPFAIRSGGHAAFAGASNIDGGVTFDMRAMNSTSLSSDRKIAHVGTGALWKDVYTAMEPENLAVVGGRVSDIGVGGLTLGGE